MLHIVSKLYSNFQKESTFFLFHQKNSLVYCSKPSLEVAFTKFKSWCSLITGDTFQNVNGVFKRRLKMLLQWDTAVRCIISIMWYIKLVAAEAASIYLSLRLIPHVTFHTLRIGICLDIHIFRRAEHFMLTFPILFPSPCLPFANRPDLNTSASSLGALFNTWLSIVQGTFQAFKPREDSSLDQGH